LDIFNPENIPLNNPNSTDRRPQVIKPQAVSFSHSIHLIPTLAHQPTPSSIHSENLSANLCGRQGENQRLDTRQPTGRGQAARPAKKNGTP